ncbi:hypothetical protein Q7P35_000532 [Cladosporium inversicolor]
MASTNGASTEKSYFEHQRELLIGDVAASLENVLQNMNRLNRSLEGVIAVGHEFSQVEGLWSQFENVMANQPEAPKDDTREGAQNERP